MKNAQRRHDISDAACALLKPHLPGQSGQWGGVAKDNRLFINAVFGYCEQELHGEICRLSMGNGELCTNGLFDGGTKEYGKNFLRS